MTIQQGEIYWLDMGVPFGSEPGYLRPYVIVQNNRFNSSEINVSQMVTVDRTRLMERIGTLSRARIREVIDGIRLVIEP